MENDVVIKYRKKLEAVQKNVPFRLVCDNMMLIDAGQNAFLKWHDDEGYFTAAMLHRDNMHRHNEPIQLVMSSYENIQYMLVRCDKYTAPKFLKALDYTDEQIENIINYFIPDMNNFVNVAPADILEEKEKYLKKQFDSVEEGYKKDQEELAKQGLDSILHKNGF